MARLLTTNMAATVLGSSLGGTSGNTTVALAAGTGALFPALPYTGDYFHGVLINSSGQSEIVKVTARSTDSLTVVRGQEGTTIRAFSAADRFELRLTAADIEFIQSSYWSRESAVVARKDADEFTVVGDLTARYVQYRSVFAIQTSSAQGFVVSSSYSAGTGLTTVVVEGLTIDSGLAAIEYGQDPTSAPLYPAGSFNFMVSADDTTPGYLETKLTLATNSGLVFATTSPAGDERRTIGLDTTVIPSRRNRLCNGDFRVDNINAGAAVTLAASGNVCDISYLRMTQASKIQSQRVAASLATFPYSMKFTCVGAVTSGAADYFDNRASIEGVDFADMLWGTARALPITVSFTIKVALTGTYSFAFQNFTQDRTYVFTEALTADTETRITKTIPGCTSGTWPTGATRVANIRFDLGSGSNLETASADTWNSDNKTRLAGSTSWIATAAGNYYEISGIQIEKGSFATPFEVLPYQQAEAWCQRYHPTFSGFIDGGGVNTTTLEGTFTLPVRPRTSVTGIATFSITGMYGANYGGSILNLTALSLYSAQEHTCQILATVAGGIEQRAGFVGTGSTQLRFTGAEL
jgi:hypothetical protein